MTETVRGAEAELAEALAATQGGDRRLADFAACDLRQSLERHADRVVAFALAHDAIAEGSGEAAPHEQKPVDRLAGEPAYQREGMRSGSLPTGSTGRSKKVCINMSAANDETTRREAACCGADSWRRGRRDVAATYQPDRR
jgi:hypothetical protein